MTQNVNKSHFDDRLKTRQLFRVKISAEKWSFVDWWSTVFRLRLEKSWGEQLSIDFKISYQNLEAKLSQLIKKIDSADLKMPLDTKNWAIDFQSLKTQVLEFKLNYLAREKELNIIYLKSAYEHKMMQQDNQNKALGDKLLQVQLENHQLTHRLAQHESQIAKPQDNRAMESVQKQCNFHGSGCFYYPYCDS